MPGCRWYTVAMDTQRFAAISAVLAGTGLIAANWDVVAGSFMVRYVDASTWSFICF